MQPDLDTVDSLRDSEDIYTFCDLIPRPLWAVRHHWLGLGRHVLIAQGMLSSLILNHANLNFGAFRHPFQQAIRLMGVFGN